MIQRKSKLCHKRFSFSSLLPYVCCLNSTYATEVIDYAYEDPTVSPYYEQCVFPDCLKQPLRNLESISDSSVYCFGNNLISLGTLERCTAPSRAATVDPKFLTNPMVYCKAVAYKPLRCFVRDVVRYTLMSVA